MDLKRPIERGSAHVRERLYEPDDARVPRRQPRLGGVAALPALLASADAFSVHLDELLPIERAAAGWCIRLGVPERVPQNSSFQFFELVVELSVSSAGVTHVIEINPYPACTIHVVGDQVAARMKWAPHLGLIEGGSGSEPIYPSQTPPAASLHWQVARGLCATTAVRSFPITEPGYGDVPLYATGFGIFSPDSAIDEAMRLRFTDVRASGRVLQHYTREDLLQVVGQYAPLPPGAGGWHWMDAPAEPLRLVFTYAERL
jgi:hypothetical protein